MALMAAITDPLRPKSRDLLYMANHSRSVSSGVSPMIMSARQSRMTVAEISGTSNPWQKASPQPTWPSSVRISTSVAERARTQPCEKAKGVSSAVRSG